MGPESAPAARISDLADLCVRCGLCLPQCPTYLLDRTEAESPRGRILLFQALAEDRLAPEPANLAALDHCLSCRRCEVVCPARVPYGELLERGRTLQRSLRRPGWRQRVLEWLLPRPALRAAGLRLAGALRGGLPGPWRRLPAIPARRRFAPNYPAPGLERGRVMLFAGCMGEHFEAAAVSGAIRLLQRLGYAVEVAREPTCCGAPHRHGGDPAGAEALFERVHATPQAAALAWLTLASGCHESLARGLARRPGAPPVRDVLAFLDADPEAARLRFRAAAPGTRVAVQVPCTQRNVLRDPDRAAAWLARIPGVEPLPLPEHCCGAAGSHMLLEPARAARLRAPLLDAIRDSGATTLCSTNVGCRMHLAAGLDSARAAVRVRHPLELLGELLDD